MQKNLKESGKKTQGIWQKKLKESDKKTQGFGKKTQGYEALTGLVGLKKVYKKQACFTSMYLRRANHPWLTTKKVIIEDQNQPTPE